MDISHLIGVLFLFKLCFLIFADLSKDVFFVYGKDNFKIQLGGQAGKIGLFMLRDL